MSLGCDIEARRPGRLAGARGRSTSAESTVAGETVDAHEPGDGNDPTVPVDPDRVDTLPPTAPVRAVGSVSGTPLGSLYVLDRVIGSGATGRVWRGRRRQDGAPVAVKLLREEFAREPVTVGRFLRQRTVLRTLQHPHLVRVHDLVAEGDVLAVVMDLVDGEDLRRLAGRRSLRTDQTLAVLGQVAEALGAIHVADVVHRDVKPENVLVRWPDREPHALLTDFGLAGAAAGPTDLTRLSQLLGTPAYTAPELVTGRPAVPATDVYALGVMAYELLSGQRPFPASNTAALLHAHVESEPVRPPGLAAPVWDLLRAMLAKDPADRPTPAAVAADLAAARAAGALPPPVPPAPPGRALATESEPESATDPAPESATAPPPPELGTETSGTREPEGTREAPSEPAVALPTTGATRPAAAEPAPPPPRRRRGRLVLALATGAVAALGLATGLYFGGSDREPPPPPPEPPGNQTYYLHATATSPRPGQINLTWDPLHETVAGFESYVILRDQTLIQDGPNLEQPFLVAGVPEATEYCWHVIALVSSDDPPPAPYASQKPNCRRADGKPENP